MRRWRASAPRRGRAGRAPARRPRSDLVRPARDARRDRVPGLRPRERRGRRSRRWWSAARRSSAPSPAPRSWWSPTRRRSTARRAARSAIPARSAAGRRRGPGHRHPEEARRPVRAHRPARGRRARGRRRGRAGDRRRAPRPLRRAHSATHLLHAALRRHLGQHVAQKGSLVAPDRLRFDFSHPKPMTPEEQAAIEAEVNAFLRQNDEVAVRLMDREAAIGAGAMALFGEKYGDEVRVVSMGRRGRPRPTRSSCAAAPMSAHRRHRAVQDHRRERGGGRHPPHRGADRRGRARHVRDEERLLGEPAAALKVAPQDLPEPS